MGTAYRLSICLAAALLALLSGAVPLRAEPVFNLPDTEAEGQSQEAANSFLESVRSVYEAILSVERREIEQANAGMGKAVDAAGAAAAQYQAIAERGGGLAAENFRALANVPAESRDRVADILEYYKLPPPGSLQELAQLAAAELALYQMRLAEAGPFSGTIDDTARVDRLQGAVGRAIYVGTVTPHFTKAEQ